MNRLKLFVLIIIATSLNVFAEPQDSVHVTDLKEFVVESKRSYVDPDKVVYIPTKKEKNLSNSPQSLIEELHSPIFQKIEGKLKDVYGNDIKYFINGEEANEIDLNNFLTGDVIRIEYMPIATNAKYKGSRGIVNFVMAEYEYGGVAQIKGNEHFTQSGTYSASSKLVYKAMTYSVLFNGSYSNMDNNNERDIDYLDIWYADKKYDKISCMDKDEIKVPNHRLNAAFNAVYRSKGKFISHYAGFLWNKDPEAEGKYQLSWTPDLFDSQYRITTRMRDQLSPTLSGSYSFVFNDHYYMSASWNYSYAKNKNHSTSTETEHETFINSNNEDVHSANASISPAYTFSQKSYIQALLNTSLVWYNIKYSGTYDNISRRFENFTTIAIQWFWQPTNQFYLNLMPGFSVDYSKSDGKKLRSKVNPSGYIDASWIPNSRFYMYLSGYYSVTPPQPSMANDVIIRESELMWRRGNSNLPAYTILNTSVTATWMPASWFSGNLSLFYSRWGNSSNTIYEAAPEDRGGLIAQYSTVKNYDNFRTQLNFNFTLLQGNLVLFGTPVWKYQRYADTDINKKLHSFSYSVGATYRLKNFGFNLSYSSSDKKIQDGGQSTSKSHDNLDFNITYGNGNWFILLGVDNITHKRMEGETYFESPHYRYSQKYSFKGRTFFISASYTFGYGKKVNRTINIDLPTSPKSGVIQ